jgi:hypothetical protein
MWELGEVKASRPLGGIKMLQARLLRWNVAAVEKSADPVWRSMVQRRRIMRRPRPHRRSSTVDSREIVSRIALAGDRVGVEKAFDASKLVHRQAD